MTRGSPGVLSALQRLVLRVGSSRLRAPAVLAYTLAGRAVGAYLVRGERDAAVYARGGVGAGDFRPGLSDLDLAIVLRDDPAGPGLGAERVKRRWDRLRRALPALELLIDLPRVHEQSELDGLVRSSAFTYGLDARAAGRDRAGYAGRRSSLDLVRTLERPGLYDSTGDWALLAGPERRPPEPGRDAQERRIAAWLELVWTWRAAFPFVAEPALAGAASACVKLIAEPARIWLWLVHGERASGRADALRRARLRIPEEDEALRRALELERALVTMPPVPLAELLPAAIRLSARVARAIGDEVAGAGATPVRLAGDPADLVLAGGTEGPPAGAPLALADWRAIVAPELPDESFVLAPADPGDPAALADASGRVDGPYPALRAEGLMILPAVPLRRTRLRAVKSPVTDPVPFAVAAGEPVAGLPEVRGWSARDTARRAVAEHAAWLREGFAPGEEGGAGHQLGRLLTAARAGLFLASLEEGEPELCLTVGETARRLAGRLAGAEAVADEALGRYRELALEGTEPPAATVQAMRDAVLLLPGYGDLRRRLSLA